MSVADPYVIAPNSGIKLMDVVTQVRISASPRELSADTDFIGLQNIAPLVGHLRSISRVSEVSSRVHQFQPGDVLYGRLRPNLRKAAVAPFSGFASGEILVLRCSEHIRPRFLLTILLSDAFADYASLKATGDRPRISFRAVADFQLDLPSLDEQDAIVARDIRLGCALTEIEQASATVELVCEALAQRMRRDLIWKKRPSTEFVRFGDLVESLDYGTSKRSDYGRNGTPVLRIPNVGSDGQIDGQDLKYAPLEKHEVDRFRVDVDDILIVRSNGSLSLVGRAAQVHDAVAGFAFAGYLLRARPRAGVLSAYLLHVIQSNEFRALVEASAQSSTGINNLSARRLAEFTVPLLPIRQQREVVSKLERMSAATSRTISNLRVAGAVGARLHARARSAWLGIESREQGEPYGPEQPRAGGDRPNEPVSYRASSVRRRTASNVSDTFSLEGAESRTNAERQSMSEGLLAVVMAHESWIHGQELFEQWLAGLKAEPATIERFYVDLIELERIGRIESRPVLDNEGRKIGDEVRYLPAVET